MIQGTHRGEYDVLVSRKVMMTARDGVRLATDIFRPAKGLEAAEGRFPAIVVRSPYDHRSSGPSSQIEHGEFFASHGFIYVVQDSRGRFASEGEFTLLDHDAEDGYDTIEWVAGLPFCDGNVGTQGTSLRAWNQHAAAALRPPHLKCMWINQGGFNGHKNALMHHGALELRWLSWLVTNGLNDPRVRRDPATLATIEREGQRMREWYMRFPWSKGNSPLAALPDYEQRALDFLTRGEDEEFWNNKNLNFEAHIDDAAPVPTMHVGSWYDAYASATLEKFEQLSARMDHQYLIMGPGIHGGGNFERRKAGEVDMGEAATITAGFGVHRMHLMLDFFTKWLTDRTPAADPFTSKPVHYYVMGDGAARKNDEGLLVHGGVWRHTDAWPEYAATPLPLTSGGGIAFAVQSATSQGSEYSEFVYDPANPTPAIASAVSSHHELLPWPARGIARPAPDVLKHSLVIQGAAQQVTRADMGHGEPLGVLLSDRTDVLSFVSEPLDEAVEVTGQVYADLFLSTDVPDTDLHVMLLDIYPPSEEWPEGYHLNLVDGLQRVRYRNHDTEPEFMTPGAVEKVRVHVGPTSNRFERGHRIGVWVSSSSFPRFDPNPNTGEPVGKHTHTRVATNRIHHSDEYPSTVILPINTEQA